jgi:hypothetical protein
MDKSTFANAVTKEVRATLEGGFRHGEVAVEGQVIPRDESGSGTRAIELVPPTVDVAVTLSTPIACSFKSTIEINGKQKSAEGIMKHSGRESFTFQFAFADFDLPFSNTDLVS